MSVTSLDFISKGKALRDKLVTVYMGSIGRKIGQIVQKTSILAEFQVPLKLAVPFGRLKVIVWALQQCYMGQLDLGSVLITLL
jgi:hypothetical protein